MTGEQTTSRPVARKSGDLHFVGSLPLDSVEEVFTVLSGDFGDHLSSMPDGEVGERLMWTLFLPQHVYMAHPDIDVRPPTEVARTEEMKVFTREGYYEAWMLEGGQFYAATLRDGVGDPVFDDLWFGDVAVRSYGAFRRLRDAGTIAPHVRFQVGVPGTISAIEPFFQDSADWPAVKRGYLDGVRREVERILQDVPSEDLVIQWDMANEFNTLSLGDAPVYPWSPPETLDERLTRVTRSVVEMADAIPEQVAMGFHCCYGTAGGWPMTEITDLAYCVAVANAAVAGSSRQVDYVHMPALADADERFLAPLADLDVGPTRIYLGLIHADHPTGLDGFRRAARRAGAHLSDFGVASVCGHGRDRPEQVPEILAYTRACLDALREIRATS